MMIGKKNKLDPNMTINVKEGNKTIPLSLAPRIKILGVTIDEDLTWKHQVKQVRGRATNVIRNLARTSGILPQKSRRILYDSLVAPHFSYADVVWDGCLQAQQQELQRAHNFAARTITGARKYDSATEALKKLGMVPLSKKRQIHQAVMAHKLINGAGPKELCAVFKNVKTGLKLNQNNGNIASRLRSATTMMIQPKQHRTAKFERSPIHRMTKVWNSVSLESKQIENNGQFKKQVQREFTRAHWGPSFSLSRPQ